MQIRTYRSGVNRMFLWMGVALVVVAVLLFGAVPVLGWSPVSYTHLTLPTILLV